MGTLYYKDLSICMATEPPMARKISESDVYTQAGLSGSYNPIHTDREYMSETQFGGRLVQNTVLLSIVEGLQRRIRWDLAIVVAYGRDGIRFTNPVYIDDTVRLKVEVVDKRPRNDEQGIVTLKQELYNQRDELALVGEYLLLLERDV